MNRCDISVVIPVYNEEKSLDELCRRLTDALSGVQMEYEVIFIDDGSTDNSYKVLERFHNEYKYIKILRLVHNYGQHVALYAGFENSRGDMVITMDADLQNDPAEIYKFLDELKKGRDAVFGWRKNRDDSFLTREVPSYIVNWLFSRFSGVRLHDYGCDFKAFNRRVVNYILEYGSVGRVHAILGAKIAGSIAEIEIGHIKRKHGSSKYSFGQLVRLTLDIILSYSTTPFKIVGLLGIVFLTLGTAWGGYYLVEEYLLSNLQHSPVPLLVLLFIGLQFVTLGFMGEYMIRIYDLVLVKPNYKVETFLQ